MKTPRFWYQDHLVSGAVVANPHFDAYQWLQRRLGQQDKQGYRASVPVICCGGATVGGAGKTTVVQDLAQRIDGAHILLRGYGAYSNALRRVLPTDSYAAVGDETLLHARIAPTWRCGDRGVSARFACHAGAKALIMDDGLQSRSIVRTLSLLIIDGRVGFGNGKVIPFGPLREPIERVVGKSDLAVVIGADAHDVARVLDGRLPVLRARTEQIIDEAQRTKGPYLAFAGIANPQRFFDALKNAGLPIADTRAFPNHYPYSVRDIVTLVTKARDAGLTLMTTPKDAARFPAELDHAGIEIAKIGLVWDSTDVLRTRLTSLGLAFRDPA